MRKFTGVLIACAAGLVLVATAIAGLNSNKSVHLTGDLEVPANASAGQGSASFHLSEDGTSVDYKLNVANIENVVAAHIHLGGVPGVNGGVGVWLFPSSTAGNGPAGLAAVSTAASRRGRSPPRTSSARSRLDGRAGVGADRERRRLRQRPHERRRGAGGTGPGDLPAGEIRGDL